MMAGHTTALRATWRRTTVKTLAKIGIRPLVFAVALAALLGPFTTPHAADREPLGHVPAEAAALLAAPAPEIELRDLDGHVQTLSSFRGQLVLVNFWATWCPPCRKEMPLFQERYERFRDAGFSVFAVAIDDLEPVQTFVDEFGLSFPIVVGQRDAFEVSQAFGNRIGALPYTVLIGRDGTVLEIYRGEVDARRLDDWLARHLKPAS